MFELFESTRDGFTVSTDPARLDMDLIHRTLATESYWAEGRSFDQVARSFAHSETPVRGNSRIDRWLTAAISANCFNRWRRRASSIVAIVATNRRSVAVTARDQARRRQAGQGVPARSDASAGSGA